MPRTQKKREAAPAASSTPTSTSNTPAQRFEQMVAEITKQGGIATFSLQPQYPEGILDATNGHMIEEDGRTPEEIILSQSSHELSWKDEDKLIMRATKHERYIECHRVDTAPALVYLNEDGGLVVQRADIPSRIANRWTFLAPGDHVELVTKHNAEQAAKLEAEQEAARPKNWVRPDAELNAPTPEPEQPAKKKRFGRNK